MPTPYRDVAHLLRRAGFGGLPNEISTLAQQDLSVIVDRLLDTSLNPAVVVPTEVNSTTATYEQQYTAIIRWWFDRMISSPTPLVEKMVLFWHNHFTSSLAKVSYYNMWNQVSLFRSRGLGNFRDLCQAAAIDPGMLIWLDNASNVATGPNENFARELMELFTMGSGNYSQADVIGVARAWTGYGVDTSRKNYQYRSANHDNNSKTIFGITKNWNGPDVIDEICLGSKSAITARFIAAKLWAYFAYDNPENAVLNDLTAAFTGSGMEISALLRAIFLRPEFYSDKARYGRVKSPSEFIATVMRYTTLDSSIFRPEGFMQLVGQYLLYPPNVAGWKINKEWVNTANMWGRINVANSASYLTKVNRTLLADTKTVSITTAAQRGFDAFGIEEPSTASRTMLENAIYSERFNNGDEQRAIITLTMLTPEFQAG